MGTIISIIVGIAIGYFFKPQINTVVKKTVKMIRGKQNKDKSYWDED